MTYRYEFDSTEAGHRRFARADYIALQESLRLLRKELENWNELAITHGGTSRPYDREVADLDRMLAWGDKELAQENTSEIQFLGISVGSLRYLKAALYLQIRRKEEDREEKARERWPSGALATIDAAINDLKNLANNDLKDLVNGLEVRPSDVLYEVLPEVLPHSAKTALPHHTWDAFISHATEDKESFVRPLAEALRARGKKIWFDEFTLTVGDSLRREIDRGLAKSRFGVVVISEDFLAKEWPQMELDGLVSREVAGTKVILPVWHNISASELMSHSPMLAGRLAAKSSSGLQTVIDELVRAMDSPPRAVQEPESDEPDNKPTPSSAGGMHSTEPQPVPLDQQGVNQAALDNLAQLLSAAINHILNRRISSDAELEALSRYNQDWWEKVRTVLEQHFTEAEQLHFTRLGVVPLASFSHAYNAAHAKILREYALREKRLRDIISWRMGKLNA